MMISGRALFKMRGSLTIPTAPRMRDAAPNRYGEPINRPKENPHLFEAVRRPVAR